MLIYNFSSFPLYSHLLLSHPFAALSSYILKPSSTSRLLNTRHVARANFTSLHVRLLGEAQTTDTLLRSSDSSSTPGWFSGQARAGSFLQLSSSFSHLFLKSLSDLMSAITSSKLLPSHLAVGDFVEVGYVAVRRAPARGRVFRSMVYLWYL